jgi:hypothetical protein
VAFFEEELSNSKGIGFSDASSFYIDLVVERNEEHNKQRVIGEW